MAVKKPTKTEPVPQKKPKRFTGFSMEETMLDHYPLLTEDAKQVADSYFKKELHQINGFKNLSLDKAIKHYIDLNKKDIPFPGPNRQEQKFTFIDLFAGIGGFRMALQNVGGKCVFSSEYDKYAQQTYKANFGEIPFGDITKAETKSFIPESFDLLCGGFPCQPFSLAGVVKKNSLGRKHGFEDEKQGNLFFHVAEILENHRPRAFFLENVKNLISHDKKNTFKRIQEIVSKLEYTFDYKVLDGKHFVPQHRERIIMVGFDKHEFGEDYKFDFDKVELPEPTHKVKDILVPAPDPKYTLSEHLWGYLQAYAKKHKEKGNGFGYGLANLEGITRTMSARYYKDGAEILIAQKGKPPRRLTPEECAALQGFPAKDFVIPVSDNQAYKQFGNSVVMPLIQSVGVRIAEILEKKPRKKR